jgi:hypothetical protein
VRLGELLETCSRRKLWRRAGVAKPLPRFRSELFFDVWERLEYVTDLGAVESRFTSGLPVAQKTTVPPGRTRLAGSDASVPLRTRFSAARFADPVTRSEPPALIESRNRHRDSIRGGGPS